MVASDVTIAIITYKRPVWLKRLLEELYFQKADDTLIFEILVVDNADDELTKEIVSSYSRKSNVKVVYAVEKVPGIVAARNKCVEIFLQTCSKNLLFIDDDEWPDRPDWVATMLEKKTQYDADIVTSRVVSIGDHDVPEWAVKLIYRNSIKKEGEIVNVFYTGNLLLSRTVLTEIRPAFDNRFAKTGASDYSFSLKCIKRGFKAIYVDAPVKEEFPKSRATIRWFALRGFRSGVGYTRAHLYEDHIVAALTKIFLMFIFRLLRGGIYFVFGVLAMSKMYIVDGIFRICSAVGTGAGVFGITYQEYRNIHGK